LPNLRWEVAWARVADPVGSREIGGPFSFSVQRARRRNKALAPRRKICISGRSATASRRGVSDATDLDDIPVRPLNNVQAGLGRPHY
jgi:hypothetical protein